MSTAMLTPPKTPLPPAGPPKRFYTVAEYLALEETATVRHEYRAGEIVEMAGATEEHGIIVANTLAEFVVQLRRSPCRAVASDLRVQTPNTRLYTYPDVVIICGESVRAGITLHNPATIVEVLSDSTEAHDRGEKFAQYQQIASLTDYVLISQHQPRIEHYARQTDAPWLYQAVSGLDGALNIASLGVTLRLEDVYDKVTFPVVETQEGAEPGEEAEETN